MVALGYMPRVTAKAAKESRHDGRRPGHGGDLPAKSLLHTALRFFRRIRPDIILLAGGTDSGDESSVEENVDIICRAGCHATVILACNRYAQRRAAERFKEAGIAYVRVPNIMPTIHELNLRKACPRSDS